MAFQTLFSLAKLETNEKKSHDMRWIRTQVVLNPRLYIVDCRLRLDYPKTIIWNKFSVKKQHTRVKWWRFEPRVPPRSKPCLSARSVTSETSLFLVRLIKKKKKIMQYDIAIIYIIILICRLISKYFNCCYVHNIF